MHCPRSQMSLSRAIFLQTSVKSEAVRIECNLNSEVSSRGFLLQDINGISVVFQSDEFFSIFRHRCNDVMILLAEID